jgi:hypothetical protein
MDGPQGRAFFNKNAFKNADLILRRVLLNVQEKNQRNGGEIKYRDMSEIEN